MSHTVGRRSRVVTDCRAALQGRGRDRREQAALRGAERSCRPIPPDPRWREYVINGQQGDVYPRGVEIEGDRSRVSNPDGLRQAGGGVTTIRATGPGQPRLIIDLGVNTGGWVEVGVAESDGTTVHLGYSEARRFLTRDGDLAGGTPGGNDDEPGSRSDDIRTAGPFRSPAIRGAQRWVSLQLEGAGTVSIDYVRVHVSHYRPTPEDYAGHFLSSDDELNRAWYASAYTFALDTFDDQRPGHTRGRLVVTDGAKRDRLIWLGDLGMETVIGNYVFAQAPAITRDSLAAFSCVQAPNGEIAIALQVDSVCPDSPNPLLPFLPGIHPLSSSSILPEYTAWFVIGVHDHHAFTGDAAFVRDQLPQIRRALSHFEKGMRDGLYLTPPNGFNWHPLDTPGGTDAHTNALVYRALIDGAALEGALGGGAKAAERYETLAATVREALRDRLWDEAAGAFRGNVQNPADNHPQDAQVEALYNRIPTDAESSQALHFLDTTLRTRYGTKTSEIDSDPYMSSYISPFMSSTELLARLEHHDVAGALLLMRRLWGHMVDTDPNSTVWEKMTVDGDVATYVPLQAGRGTLPHTIPFGGPGFTSLAHGWGGGPVPALSGYVLGIRPMTPGFERWVVEPQPGDLRFAQGQAPTPHGPLVSRWTRDGDQRFTLTVSAPKGTSGSVAVPTLGRSAPIYLDGRLAWSPGGRGQGTHDGDYVRFEDVRGTHTFAWSARR